MNKVINFTVRVPATTANFGSGFDSIGMALDLWNIVEVSSNTNNNIIIEGEGEGQLSIGKDHLIYSSMVLAADRIKFELPPLLLRSINSIPLTRGLGSSAAAVVAGVMITNHLAGNVFDEQELLNLCSEIEGHPDNVAPALFGGVRLVVKNHNDYVDRDINIKGGLDTLVLIPDFTLETKSAREVIPSQVPINDAVFNLSRSSLLVRSMLTGDWKDLKLATEDRLHQIYRVRLIPEMQETFDALLKAGAYAVFISGAGPTIIGLIDSEKSGEIYAELNDHIGKTGFKGRVLNVNPSILGAHVIEG
jgi:homoserine kinase